MANYQNSWELHQLFQQHLLPGETIRWAGQPDPNVIFNSADVSLIPLSLLVGGTMFFCEGMALGLYGPYRNCPRDLTPVFLIPLVLVAIYMIFGRFIVKRWRKQRTFYAITNARALILKKMGRDELEAVDLKTVSSISKYDGRNGTGMIVFGDANASFWTTANTGLEGFRPRGMSDEGIITPAFFDITGVDFVYNLLNQVVAEWTH